mgnify:CR=1 FL=1
MITIFSYGQNTISIKKKKEVKKSNTFPGFYYSKPLIEEHKNSAGIVSYKKVRYYLYFTSSKAVYLFTSPLSPNKALKKFSKKREKIANEVGEYEASNRTLYLTLIARNSRNPVTYRYVGQIGEDFIYLDYKAAYRQKIALDIYLYKLNN